MEEQKPIVATIVVTYNRSNLLKNCLMAIDNQSFKPSVVFIIDNASTDNTEELVKAINHEIPYEYIKLPENIGGAGGFYTGLKIAHGKAKYDAFWVMDDDGLPDSNCLRNLLQYICKFHYIAPLTVSIENRKDLSFPFANNTNISDIENSYPNGVIYNHANPFNGILLTKDALDVAGYPIKEMFIWGDEVEYDARLKSLRFNPITITRALHYHPKDKMNKLNDFRGIQSIIFTDSSLRNYCKYRNAAYTIIHYGNKIGILNLFIKYSIFFLFQRNFDIKNLMLFCSAIWAGINNNFKGHTRFIKNDKPNHL